MQIYSIHFIPFSIRLNKNKIYKIFTDIYSDTKNDYKCIDIFMIQLYF